jgi:hypothetical protein
MSIVREFDSEQPERRRVRAVHPAQERGVWRPHVARGSLACPPAISPSSPAARSRSRPRALPVLPRDSLRARVRRLDTPDTTLNEVAVTARLR